jgi:hypothetical protein
VLCRVLLCMSAEDQSWVYTIHTCWSEMEEAYMKGQHLADWVAPYLYAVRGAPTGAVRIVEIQR